ncbi:PREDICTED: N-alpha-acetyltransferase 40 isoform X2 [Tarenaya hassleriana]|uniref:N-alpha-acetyltransferase 40 isoform X2 n=1 Tax=Tarenaya hassleriana TaxID=28532 RepID=UPI00053C5266|nr:PREDICTED: N-alpha-acetyltransferase 40 isoform X2 [Tarenaya hassleriana]
MDSKKRRKILDKKKAIREVINRASSFADPLSSLPSFRRYSRNGLSVFLESDRGDKLSSSVRQYIRMLLRMNMAGFHGSDWRIHEKVKHREMVSPDARYIFVRELLNGRINEVSKGKGMEVCDQMAGFVHYRFTLEEEMPVLYVYEIQLESRVQGKGLGEFLMQLVELIACKNRMGAVVLTVQKSNSLAMTFYMSKLRYKISSISPSKNGACESYEILCKTFDPEARSVLEDDDDDHDHDHDGRTSCKKHQVFRTKKGNNERDAVRKER